MTAPVLPSPLPDEIEARWDAATSRPARWKMADGTPAIGVLSSRRFEKVLDGIEEIAAHVAQHVDSAEGDAFATFRERMGDTLRQSVVDFVSELEAGRLDRRQAVADSVTG